MIGLLATAAALAMTAGGCGDTLCNARVLEPFFDKLDTAKDRSRGRRPVHILQIGDSHTAGDTVTGGWRDILQARYGSGGRGVLPPGRPYQGYLTRWVTAEMSPGWRIAATFGGASSTPRPAMGVSGFSITSTTPGARIALTADANQTFDRFVICASARPDAGALNILIGGRVERMRLDSPTPRPECKTITTDQPQTRVEVSTDGDPVTITSWATFRDSGGVVLSNVGVVGSQLVHFSRTDDAVIAEELRSYKPDLIVLAFGTNEGFAAVFRPQEYEITLRTQIGRIRRLAGNVPILLLGAPDALTRRPELLRNAPVATPAPCLEPMAAADPAPPVPYAPASAQVAMVDDRPFPFHVADSFGMTRAAVPFAAIAPQAAAWRGGRPMFRPVAYQARPGGVAGVMEALRASEADRGGAIAPPPAPTVAPAVPAPPVVAPAPMAVQPLAAPVAVAPRPQPAPPQAASASAVGNDMTMSAPAPATTAAPRLPTPTPAMPVSQAPRVSTVGWSVRANPLFPPAGLDSVRGVQRRVAASLNLAFWDWQAKLGGRCAAVKFAKGNPPLMRGDYVHFNSAGGREVANRLQADLDRAMAARR